MFMKYVSPKQCQNGSMSNSEKEKNAQLYMPVCAYASNKNPSNDSLLINVKYIDAVVIHLFSRTHSNIQQKKK